AFDHVYSDITSVEEEELDRVVDGACKVSFESEEPPSAMRFGGCPAGGCDLRCCHAFTNNISAKRDGTIQHECVERVAAQPPRSFGQHTSFGAPAEIQFHAMNASGGCGGERIPCTQPF